MISTTQKEVFNWPPLESNDEIFTEYLVKLGMDRKWLVFQCFGLDDDCLGFVPKPTVAVIANYERLDKPWDHSLGSSESTPVPYYMKQTNVLDNACGIIACLHSVLNNLNQIPLEEGSILQRFNKAAEGKTPEQKATLLEEIKDFQDVHKIYANQGQSKLAEEQSDVKHHYCAFVLTDKGLLVELDGRKQGPHVIKEGCEDLLKETAQVLLKRIEDKKISESLAVLTLSKDPEAVEEQPESQ